MGLRLPLTGVKPIMADTSAITISLGLLAAAITLAGALVTRGNLISGFRQTWINDQRSDLAVITSKATIISSNLRYDKTSDLESISAAISRVKLRENPKKPEWNDVIAAIDDLNAELWSNISIKHDVTRLVDRINDRSRIPLKRNWTKTSYGETIYIIALIAIGAFIVLVIILLIQSLGTAAPSTQSTAAAVNNPHCLAHSLVPAATANVVITNGYGAAPQAPNSKTSGRPTAVRQPQKAASLCRP